MDIEDAVWRPKKQSFRNLEFICMCKWCVLSVGFVSIEWFSSVKIKNSKQYNRYYYWKLKTAESLANGINRAIYSKSLVLKLVNWPTPPPPSEPDHWNLPMLLHILLAPATLWQFYIWKEKSTKSCGQPIKNSNTWQCETKLETFYSYCVIFLLNLGHYH